MKGDGLGQIKDALSIRDRPASVEVRAVPSHWEGDLIAGAANSFIAVLVERQSRFVMLAKASNKGTQGVMTTLIKQSQELPRELYGSLMWDRGTEMSGLRRFTLATDVIADLWDRQSP